MSILNRLTVSTVLIATFLMAQAAQATTYYVSTTGSDGAAGNNIATPWRTLTFAAARIACGDTALVRGGTYTTEGNIRFRQTTCTQQTPVTMKNYPGESPIVHWTDSTNTNFRFELYSDNLTIPVTDIVVQGLEIWGGYECFKLNGTLRMIIRGNYCHGSYGNGITGVSSGGNLNGTIDSNIVTDNGDWHHPQCLNNPLCNQIHGIYITGQNWTITNNLFYDNLGYGLQAAAYAFVSGQMPSSSYEGFSGLVANNTFAYQRNRGGIALWNPGGGLANTTVENNLFYENSQAYDSSSQGIDFVSCCTSGNIVRNNLWFGTGNSLVFTTGVPNGTTISGTTNAAPRLANAPATLPASPNFRLQAGSPAIDKGLSLSLVTVDIAGVPRPQGLGHDIGAYEGVSSSDTAPPNAPLGLAVR